MSQMRKMRMSKCNSDIPIFAGFLPRRSPVTYRALVITCTTATTTATTTTTAIAIFPPDPDDHLRTWVENPSQYNKANTGR